MNDSPKFEDQVVEDQNSERFIAVLPGAVSEADKFVADANEMVKNLKREAKKAFSRAWLTARAEKKAQEECGHIAETDEEYEKASLEAFKAETDAKKAEARRDELSEKLTTARQIYKKYYGADQGNL